MLKNFFLVVLFALPAIGNAQVTINAQLPQAGFVQKEQLWNLILINNNTDVLDISMQMNLKDVNTGQVVLTAATGNLLLAKGVKMIRSGDVQPIAYSYTSPDLSGNYLPMGAYVACYQIINNINGKETALAEESIRINIDPLSPPMLNSPSNKSAIENPYPQFTWMPPTPFDMFSSLSYDLLVTEVLPGQNPTEAIQYNTPIYSKANISQPYESYASSFNKLDTGKLYAWQVVAKNGLSYAAKTEVWTFKYTKDTALVATDDDAYLLLDKQLTGTYKIAKNVLHIKYYSFSPTYTAKLLFTDEKGNTIKQATQQIVAGDNYFDVDVANRFTQNKIYTFSLIDKENTAHYLTFRIQKK
jgi:hypothetical protein